ncbi:MAG: hypothetical protein K8T26_03765 [Lentisphaerae bacterium]|nr:hypothetical protein [Lentisphaerota bacterium]
MTKRAQQNLASARASFNDLGERIATAAESRGKGAVYLFTSVSAGAGRSMLASCAAAHLAESGRKVILATVGESGGRKTGVALEDLRAGRASLTFAAGQPARLSVGARLSTLPADRRAPTTWVDDFDIMIVDAPVLSAFATTYLTPLVDGVILVVDVRNTSVRAIARARQNIADHKGQLLGAVLNRYHEYVPAWIQSLVQGQ